jgi:hypothetical protein
LRNTGCIEELGRLEPPAGQVKPDTQGVTPGRTNEVDSHGDLAVELLFQRSTVLALDTHGPFALLGEGDFIDDQDAAAVRESLSHQGTVAVQHVPLFPRALVEEVL